MYNPFFNIAFVEGYMQCQEDMTDYVFECHTSDTHFSDVYEETINSINKQD